MSVQRLYVVLAHWDSGYVDLCVPDFPGLTSVGDTAEMALRALDECWRDFVSGLEEDGMPLPFPTPEGALAVSGVPELGGALVLLRPLPA